MDTISNKIVRLYSATSAIREAILSKGGTVLTSDGLETFPQAIGTIPVGGSGIEVADEDVEMLRSMVNGSYQENVVSFEVCRLRDYAFQWNSEIVEANFPYCLEIGDSVFYRCTSLQQISFPNCTTIGQWVFCRCASLQSVYFPNCSTIGSYAFYSCTSLQQVSFPNCSTIKTNAFYNCTSLQSVYLLSTSVCALSNSKAFYSTPLSESSYLGYFGSIYVPSSLLTAYQTTTNWTYYSSRFIGV